MRRLAVLIASLLVSVAVFAQDAPCFSPTIAPDFVIVPGVGYTGHWDTIFRISDISDAGAATNLVRGPGGPIPLAPNSTVTMAAYASGMPEGVRSYIFSSDDAARVPVVSARIINRARPQQSAAVPVTTLSTLLAAKPRQLVFASAAARPGMHSNLALVLAGGCGNSAVTLEAWSDDGRLLASRSVPVNGTGDFQDVSVPDVGSFIGVHPQNDFQLRARVEGSGYLTGALSTVGSDGTLVIVPPSR